MPDDCRIFYVFYVLCFMFYVLCFMFYVLWLSFEVSVRPLGAWALRIAEKSHDLAGAKTVGQHVVLPVAPCAHRILRHPSPLCPCHALLALHPSAQGTADQHCRSPNQCNNCNAIPLRSRYRSVIGKPFTANATDIRHSRWYVICDIYHI